MTITHTYATLEVPGEIYNLVRARLIAAGYGHLEHYAADEPLDMHGIALVPESHNTGKAPHCINRNDSKGVVHYCDLMQRCPQSVFPTGSCRAQVRAREFERRIKAVRNLFGAFYEERGLG